MVTRRIAGAVWSAVIVCSAVSAAFADVQLPEMVVTATKTERKLQDVTQDVTLITAGEIQKSGATTIGEIVRTTVGAIVNEQGPLGGLTTVRLRGSSYQQVLVLLDGTRMNSMRDGGFDLSELPVPLDAIERIEIVRGPASALYGADAVGGVVNIITKKTYVPSTTIRGSMGARGYSDLMLANTGRDDALYYSLFADKEHSAGYRVNSDLDKENAGLKLGYAFSADSSLELKTDYLTKKVGVPGPTFAPSPNAQQFTRDLMTGIEYKVRFSKDLDLKIGVNEKRDTLNYTDPSIFVDSTHKTDTRGTEMQVNWVLNSWNFITLGAEARRDHLDSTDSGGHAASLEAEYLQDEMSLGDSMILVVGGRKDKHSLYGTKWSPKASARYLFASSGTILRASYGKSFRAPTFNDLYWPYSNYPFADMVSGITTNYITQGNSNLLPETAEEYEGGIEQPFGTGNTLKITGFKRRVKNLIQWQELITQPTASTTNDQFSPVNIGRARITGYEAEAKFALSDTIMWSINYTHLIPVNELTGERITSDAAPMPDIQVGSSLTAALDSQTVLALDGRWVKNYVEPGKERWVYYTVDGKITDTVSVRKDSRTEVFVGMKNVFNRKYETAKGYPMPPAEVYGGIAVQF